MTTSQASGSVPRQDDPREPSGASDAVVPTKEGDRIGSLDFIRGIAVMGILAANIIAFGQPTNAYIYPEAFLVPNGDPGGWQWIAQFVLIDGKMRGLFTVLFGAGMYLFMERAWARGEGRGLQAWRLLLLASFGFIHFFFIWMGDILFYYGVLGMIALLCMRWTAKTQLMVGLVGYALGALMFAGMLTFPHMIAETSVGEGEGMADFRAEISGGIEEALASDKVPTELKTSGDYAGLVAHRFSEDWATILGNVGFMLFEMVPLMLIGMALYRLSFFGDGYSRSGLIRWGWVGLAVGGAIHLLIGLYVQSTGFAFYASTAAIIGWSTLPRIAMVLGLAALMVAYSPGWTGWLAERVRAAGRAAFTNYLGTSILMLFVMHGWALGLFGELNRPQLYLLTAVFWILMLVWSKPWLERYRYGPLEWLWRCMTYRKVFPLKR